MSDTFQSQPSVVLRPTRQQLRALLTIAAIVIVALTIAVVVLATNSGTGTVASSATSAKPSASTASTAGLHSRAVASEATQPLSNATTSPQVGPNPDQRDLISSGSTFAPAGPNPDQATP